MTLNERASCCLTSLPSQRGLGHVFASLLLVTAKHLLHCIYYFSLELRLSQVHATSNQVDTLLRGSAQGFLVRVSKIVQTSAVLALAVAFLTSTGLNLFCAMYLP